MTRLSEFDPETMTDAQRTVYENIIQGPRGGLRGPFKALLHAPELADLVQGVGGHLRFDGALRGDLRELAILVTARHIRAQYEWFAHAPIGEKDGLDPAIVEAIRTGAEPVIADEQTALVYRFAKKLHEEHCLDDATYAAAVDEFGHAGVVELVVLCGYYTLIGFTLNAFEILPPPGEEPFTD